MDELSLSAQFAVLAVLLVISGFFSMAETAMMASNRHRLRHLAGEGHRGAQLATQLLSKVDRLLGVILLGNTLINAAAAMLTGHIAITVFGEEKWSLEAGAIFVTICLLVFSEITPKVIGATYPDLISQRISFILTPLLRISYPVVWFANLFVTGLLKLLRLQPKPGHEMPRLSPEDLRGMVLEAGHFIPHQHQTMLLNLFDLEHISVEDIMTPRGEIEAIDLQSPLEDILQQLSTSFHTRLPVYDGDPGNIIGILHQRRLLANAIAGDLDQMEIRSQLAEPYYIPAATTIYAQLQFFQENRQRVGLVVDEYGEIEGLVTLEDIIEEIIGKFTTSMPTSAELTWETQEEGGESALVDGARSLRELNRTLDLNFSLDGPKTLNGLILEHLQDIPESGLSVKINGVPMEIVQAQDRRIRMVRIFRPSEDER
ncbi:MAG TPA: HlyC/CorC family transporter [Rhodocyclaceae bacterium]|nr:HlyC/CorC family transporter [Rhodocyclaceae bacterium]